MTVKIGSLVTVLIKPHNLADAGQCAAVVTRVHTYVNGVAVVNYRLISDDDDEHGRRVTSATVYSNRAAALAFVKATVTAAIGPVVEQGQTLDKVLDPRASGMLAYED